MQTKQLCFTLPFLIALTACATNDGVTEPVLDAPVADVEKTETAMPSEEMAMVEAAPEPEIRPLPDPKTLLEKSPLDIVTLLGDPGLVRREDRVQVLQYDADHCVLDIVFREQNGGGFLSHYYDVRAVADGSESDAAQCLDAILIAREAAQ